MVMDVRPYPQLSSPIRAPPAEGSLGRMLGYICENRISQSLRAENGLRLNITMRSTELPLGAQWHA